MSRRDRVLGALVDLAALPLLRRDPVEQADAIAVFGAPLAPGGGLTDVLEERVRAGVDLYRRGLAPVVCISGGGPPGRIEAEPMVALALELGVPEGALRVDRTARSTRDNARRIAELLFPGATVWVVTQPFHTRRAARALARAGLRPLAWHIAGSLQYRHPERALRWIAREYAALLSTR